MKKNIYKRGVTIVEILLSILIIGMVVIVLFNMLVNVRNEDRNNQIQSRYVLNQAQFTERIQEDLIDSGIYQISACDIYQVDVESYKLYNQKETCFENLESNTVESCNCNVF
jgi:Tfp pilus assembly protein PilV